jgi:hypothetical protein
VPCPFAARRGKQRRRACSETPGNEVWMDGGDDACRFSCFAVQELSVRRADVRNGGTRVPVQAKSDRGPLRRLSFWVRGCANGRR